MNADIAVITHNLDYLLWGDLAHGTPGGGAAGVVYHGGVDPRDPDYLCYFLAIVFAARPERY